MKKYHYALRVFDLEVTDHKLPLWTQTHTVISPSWTWNTKDGHNTYYADILNMYNLTQDKVPILIKGIMEYNIR